jgi:hypothetical protein
MEISGWKLMRSCELGAAAWDIEEDVIVSDTGINDVRTHPTNATFHQSVCSKCPDFAYTSPEEFREHCKTGWHLENLKHGRGFSFERWATCEQFHSDSESSASSAVEEQEKPFKLILNGIPYTRLPGQRIAIPSIYLGPSTLSEAKFFVVLLLRSGRFAGAVWDHTGKVLSHTSSKRYTVRRKNGGSQSKNDNQKGSPANSIGAQIRRAQERKLSDDVFTIINEKWRQYLMEPTTVVLAYASKNQVKDIFVGPLENSKAVCKILKVPISVRHPTYAEVCRVYRELTSVAVKT